MLDCGCRIESFGVFAARMRKKNGRAVVTSVRWSRCSGPEAPTYFLRVRGKSLTF